MNEDLPAEIKIDYEGYRCKRETLVFRKTESGYINDSWGYKFKTFEEVRKILGKEITSPSPSQDFQPQ